MINYFKIALRKVSRLKYYDKYAPMYLLWAVLAFTSAYKIMIVQKAIYNKYNGQVGVIEWVSKSDHSGIHLCGVRLPDGTYNVVNAGRYNWKEGDKYVNRMHYTMFFGFMGTAYVVLPPNTPGVFWTMAYFCTFILPLTIMICYFLWTWWIGFSNRKQRLQKSMDQVIHEAVELINQK